MKTLKKESKKVLNVDFYDCESFSLKANNSMPMRTYMKMKTAKRTVIAERSLIIENTTFTKSLNSFHYFTSWKNRRSLTFLKARVAPPADLWD